MLKIGKKGNDVQMKEVLDSGYSDITSVVGWIGVVRKYGYDKVEAAKQIELFMTSLGENVDAHNKHWYDFYKTDNLLK